MQNKSIAMSENPVVVKINAVISEMAEIAKHTEDYSPELLSDQMFEWVHALYAISKGIVAEDNKQIINK